MPIMPRVGVEDLLRGALLDLSKDISVRDHMDAMEYVDHGEYGVAYELIKFVVERDEIAPPDSLLAAGRLMNMPEW